MYWTRNSTNNLSSYCGLVDAKIRASDKDLPVLQMKNYVCLSDPKLSTYYEQSSLQSLPNKFCLSDRS